MGCPGSTLALQVVLHVACTRRSMMPPPCTKTRRTEIPQLQSHQIKSTIMTHGRETHPRKGTRARIITALSLPQAKTCGPVVECGRQAGCAGCTATKVAEGGKRQTEPHDLADDAEPADADRSSNQAAAACRTGIRGSTGGRPRPLKAWFASTAAESGGPARRASEQGRGRC